MPLETAIPSSFAQNVSDLIDRITYRRLSTEVELDSIRALRYAAYLKEGAIAPNDAKRLIDPFDDMKNAVNVGLFYGRDLVAAMRVHFLSDKSDLSPSKVAFPDILDPLLEEGRGIIDPNRFVVDYGAAQKLPNLVYATMRVSVMASAYYSSDISIASVRTEHRAFYKRAFFATPAAAPRAYPGLIKDLCLMFINFGKDRDRILARNPFYDSTRLERERLFWPIPERSFQSTIAAA